ncbi:MAG: hypothetical protein CSB33_00965 [Desulfobacterales bacterium]|nr:MAG: hypothetical protein CSB33_00965 [Desulfobacterales bacterium]
MKKLGLAAIAALVGFCFAGVGVVFAGSEIDAVKDQLEELTEQNEALMKKIEALEEKAGVAEGEEAEEMLSFINDHVNFSGAIEVEAGWGEDFEGEKGSSIDLATASFAFEASGGDHVSGTMAIDWDGDEDKLTIDEAFITVDGGDDLPLFFQGGRYVVPFGVYEANTLSDPLTCEVFEIKEDNLMIGSAFGPVTVSGYIFNGDSNEDGGEDHIEHFGLAANLELEAGPAAISGHLGYLSSVVDTDGLCEDFDLEADYAGGLAAQAMVELGDIGLVIIAEFITALDELEMEGNDVEPKAWHMEVDYNINVPDYPMLAALSYSGTDDLGGLYSESRLAVALGVDLGESLGVTLELAHDEDYGESDGGTGESANTFTAQLAYEF